MFVSVGNSRMDKKFNGQEMSYEDFAKRLSQTTYTAETMEQYRKMPKSHWRRPLSIARNTTC